MLWRVSYPGLASGPRLDYHGAGTSVAGLRFRLLSPVACGAKTVRSPFAIDRPVRLRDKTPVFSFCIPSIVLEDDSGPSKFPRMIPKEFLSQRIFFIDNPLGLEQLARFSRVGTSPPFLVLEGLCPDEGLSWRNRSYDFMP